MLIAKTIALMNLLNAEHYSFMKEVVGTLKSLEGKSENEVFNQTLTNFNATFNKEAEIYKLVSEKRGTEKHYDIAAKRKTTFLCFRHALEDIVKASLSTAPQAEMLLQHFDTFKTEIHRGLPSQTAAVDNVLEELAKEANQQALTEIGEMKFYDQLKAQHEEYAAKLGTVRKYDRNNIKAAMLSVRTEIDELYKVLVRRLENFADLFGEPFLSALLDLNATIESFKTTIKRREVNRETAKRKEELNAGNKPSTDVKPGDPAKPNGQAGEQTPPTDQQAGGDPAKPAPNPAPTPDPGADPKPDTGSGHGTGGVTEVFPEGTPEANQKAAQ